MATNACITSYIPKLSCNHKIDIDLLKLRTGKCFKRLICRCHNDNTVPPVSTRLTQYGERRTCNLEVAGLILGCGVISPKQY
jgi:hypothetical protein